MKTGIEVDEFWIDCINPQSPSIDNNIHHHNSKSQDTLEKERYLNMAKKLTIHKTLIQTTRLPPTHHSYWDVF